MHLVKVDLLDVGVGLLNGLIERGRSRSHAEDTAAACHFDESAGDRERPLKALDDSEVWELLGGDGNA